jgi:hypothetical protein
LWVDAGEELLVVDLETFERGDKSGIDLGESTVEGFLCVDEVLDEGGGLSVDEGVEGEGVVVRAVRERRGPVVKDVALRREEVVVPSGIAGIDMGGEGVGGPEEEDAGGGGGGRGRGGSQGRGGVGVAKRGRGVDIGEAFALCGRVGEGAEEGVKREVEELADEVEVEATWVGEIAVEEDTVGVAVVDPRGGGLGGGIEAVVDALSGEAGEEEIEEGEGVELSGEVVGEGVVEGS